MTAEDFRRIALALEGAEEHDHMGNPGFRVGGHYFATLVSEDEGYGNLMLTQSAQLALIEKHPKIFLPIPGGWGRMGMTHVRLAMVKEKLLVEALHTAWQLRVEKNERTKKRRRVRAKLR